MLALFGLGTSEILLIVLIVLILFGAARIPQVMGGLGKGIKEFKKGISGDEAALRSGNKDAEPEKDKHSAGHETVES